MITLTLETSSLEALISAMDTIEPKLPMMMSAAVNVGGARLTTLAEAALAMRFPEMAPAAIASALTSSLATEDIATYTLAANGADLPYFRWLTQRDEKVCKICGPRDGRIYSTRDAGTLFPAHPNCRCRLDRIGLGSALIDAADAILPEPMQIATDHFLAAFTTEWNAIDRRLP